jgi:hypothetical protein
MMLLVMDNTFVTGDVELSPKYYPYIREKKMGGRE